MASAGDDDHRTEDEGTNLLHLAFPSSQITGDEEEQSAAGPKRPPLYQKLSLAKLASGITLLALATVLAFSALRGVSSWHAERRSLTNPNCGDLGEDPTAAVVVTYNLFWWCVSDQYGTCKKNGYDKGFKLLGDRLRQNEPFGMIGLQECENIDIVLAHAGLDGCMDYHKGWPPNDIPQAWSKQKFDLIEKGTETIAHDRYGARWMNWVRLASKATGGTILFANAHGPLEECDGAQGVNIADNYVKAINVHKKPGDVVIFTGDFNCGSDTDMTMHLSSKFANDATDKSFGGADHVLSNGLHVVSQDVVDGKPSDHQMVKAVLRVPGAASGGLMT